MCHAVFGRRLPRGQLEVTAELETTVVARALDVEHRVAAPHRWVNGLAHGRRAAAPLVGEEQFGGVVVERGGVPERKRGIGHVIKTLGLPDVLGVEQQSVARTRAAEQLEERVTGHVVATGCWVRAWFACALTTAAQAGEFTGIRVRKDVGMAHHLGLLRVLERHLDHVDAERRGVRRAGIGHTSGLLFSRAHARIAGDIDVEVLLVVWIGDKRVGVGSAACLHGRHLARFAWIGNVEDADAKHAERIGRRGTAPATGGGGCGSRRSGWAVRAAVDAAVPFHGHKREVAPHGDVALAARARDDRLQRHLGGILDVVKDHPVEVALERQSAVQAEGEIGVGVVQAARVGRLRIKHAFRLAHRADEFEVERGFTGVVFAGFQPFAWIGHVAGDATTATTATTSASCSRRIDRRLCRRDLLRCARLRQRDLTHRRLILCDDRRCCE